MQPGGQSEVPRLLVLELQLPWERDRRLRHLREVSQANQRQ
jgi:hypothetical protein